MFRGSNDLNLDDKGRLAIPKRYRDHLKENDGGHLVLTRHPLERCLQLFPLGIWKIKEDQLNALPTWDRKASQVRRMVQGQAVDCVMDSMGRILIPPGLRSNAALEKEVTLAGQGEKFELWSRAAWEAQRAAWDEILEQAETGEVSEALKQLTL
ncbi:MAG TPA: cell division/cell wall cluster transcriptional repressor MraZ [Gammaproteobacteria bacterium]|nr:cell division/cell wall cluster transcriptional repressor MraZ [Gammaproteobacteria bacterium]